MKPQDIAFLIILIVFFLKRNFRLTALIGMLCIVIAIPLFAKWIFFTAEHLIWYSAAFFLVSIFQILFEKYDNRN